MNAAAVEVWLKALEDPNNQRRQIQGKFRIHDENEVAHYEHCCAVGLAMGLFVPTGTMDDLYPVFGGNRWSADIITDAVHLNDTQGKTFAEIAAILRKRLADGAYYDDLTVRPGCSLPDDPYDE